MKFGVLLRGQFPEEADPGKSFAEICHMARHADALGFDSIVKGSHFAADGLLDFHQIAILGRLSAEAPNCRLNAGIVLLSLHKPLDVAEQIATLDVMTGGKMIFGCGLGYRQVEFDGFGTTQAERVPRLEENLEVIKRLWVEPKVSHQGTHFRLENVSLGVRPVQSPHPPVWMGANAEPAIRRAARIADCWYMPPHNRIDTLLKQFDIYRAELERVGKMLPAELPLRREVFVASSREEALRLCRDALARKYRQYDRWGQGKPMPAGDNDLSQSVEDLLENRFILGSPEEACEQLYAICRPLQANHLVISVHNPGMALQVALDSMQLFAEEVIPAMRSALR